MSSARRYGSRSRTTALRMEQLEERWVPSVAGAFLETPLVSDQTGVAPITDADLVNGWGIAMNPTSGGFWVSSNGANLTDIYTGDVNGTALAKAGLEVTIPGGAPTGQVFNPTTDFVVTSGATSGPAQFITASENGIVTGWNPNVPASSTTAQTAFTASDAAVYKGIALANNGAGNFLYLADFHNNKIDVLDSSFHLTTLSGNFTDPNEATGFAPFNIAAINGQLYVSYALQDAAKHDDVAGAGNGYIDVFDLNGNFVKRLVSQGALNSPWGMVQAPAGFSNLGGDLLVGNFGDGKINAYNATDGTLIGSLDTANGQPMVIDGLWGLTFGNGQTAGSTKTLYFAAGPDAEAHGLFGKITSPARGGNGIGSDVVAVSGQANGAAQLFNLHADGTLTAQGSPISPFGSMTSDVRSATGDVDGDGIADTVLITGPGVPIRFAVVSGKDGSLLVPPSVPFSGSDSFIGGGFVTVGDIDGDGKAEIVLTPDQGGGPRVTIFDLVGGVPTVKANFFGIADPNFRGGARAALGDIDGDGIEDLAVAAGFSGGPRVSVYRGTTLLSGTPTNMLNDFFAFPGSETLRNGVYLTLGDFDGDGFADMAFGGGPGGGPRVFVVSGAMISQGLLAQAQAAPIANFFAFDSSQRNGVRLTAKEGNGDGDRELIAASGAEEAPLIMTFAGSTLRGGTPPAVSFTPFPEATEADGVFVG